MKSIIFIALCFMSAWSYGASPAATQRWVEEYVTNTIERMVAKTRNISGGKMYTAGTGDDQVTLIVEDRTVHALMATNVTWAAVTSGITNGMYFVWEEFTHSYTNHNQVIEATKTNLVWNGIQSVGGTFSNRFDVVSQMIQPIYAKEVTK